MHFATLHNKKFGASIVPHTCVWWKMIQFSKSVQVRSTPTQIGPIRCVWRWRDMRLHLVAMSRCRRLRHDVRAPRRGCRQSAALRRRSRCLVGADVGQPLAVAGVSWVELVSPDFSQRGGHVWPRLVEVGLKSVEVGENRSIPAKFR